MRLVERWTRSAVFFALALLLSAAPVPRQTHDHAAPGVVASNEFADCHSGDVGDGRHPGDHRQSGHMCFSCPSCCGGVATLDIPEAVFLVAMTTERVAWLPDVSMEPRRPRERARFATGPPSFS